MPVADQKILKKMMNELSLAIAAEHDPSKMKGHIRAVRLLTDLFLDEESTTKEEEVLKKVKEEQEIKDQNTYKRSQEPQTLDHDDANGSSIFDF